jgi:hypothetical protein
MLVSSFPVKPTVGQTYSSNGLNWKWSGTRWNVDFSTSSFTNVTITGTLSLVNTNITGVNSLQFNDPGADEGISWLSGNLWKIYESPNDNTNPAVNNAAGNLQFVQNTTRRLTIDSTTGDLTTHKSLYIGDDRTSTAGLALQIGVGRTDSGYAFIDLVGDTTHTDYGLRIIRNNNGANADSTINHRGNGALRLIAEPADGLDVGGSIQLVTNNVTRQTISATGVTTFSGNVQLGAASTLSFEGSTNDAFDTTVTVVNPTANRTITLPNSTGTVALTSEVFARTSSTTSSGESSGVNINTKPWNMPWGLQYHVSTLSNSIVSDNVAGLTTTSFQFLIGRRYKVSTTICGLNSSGRVLGELQVAGLGGTRVFDVSNPGYFNFTGYCIVSGNHGYNQVSVGFSIITGSSSLAADFSRNAHTLTIEDVGPA